MTALVTTCRTCGQPFEPSPEAIRFEAWRLCLACSPKPEAVSHCRECGRPLAGKRDLCLRCAGIDIL
jgi:hypothetical protein